MADTVVPVRCGTCDIFRFSCDKMADPVVPVRCVTCDIFVLHHLSGYHMCQQEISHVISRNITCAILDVIAHMIRYLDITPGECHAFCHWSMLRWRPGFESCQPTKWWVLSLVRYERCYTADPLQWSTTAKKAVGVQDPIPCAQKISLTPIRKEKGTVSRVYKFYISSLSMGYGLA